MNCHWKGVREETKWDHVREATRDQGRIVPGLKPQRPNTQWSGKHRWDSAGLVCMYRRRPKLKPISDLPKCPRCGRELVKVLDEGEWQAYLKMRRHSKSYATTPQMRQKGFRAWYEPSPSQRRSRLRGNAVKGSFWVQKHWREGRELVCGYTSKTKRHQRWGWANDAEKAGLETCRQCGRPVKV